MSDIVVLCRDCLVEPERVDLPEGVGGLARAGSAHVEFVCPSCGKLVSWFWDGGTLDLDGFR